MRTIFLTSFITILASGCSSAPPKVQASRPLVEIVIPTASKVEVPSQLWQKLSNDPAGSIVEFENLQVTLGSAYFSGLGQLCRKVDIQQQSTNHQTANLLNVEKRIVCLQEATSKWMLIPVVIDEQTSARGFSQ
ncbi:hypothetical protein [Shewanella sp. 6_MG-2023]|uniref:hypothetical protein n=1 Tax=Shewanella sp. 6_MG-2023 TaxID=3062660 RepID=UPI0026E1C998|nr:hypothetical protein [Shewanella sp. 6_MG-2023]MDO6617597.1 hypothetical protein [Shewanella sp. 6_MG-2023]